MKKIIILFILLYGQLYAMDRASTLKLYHHMFSYMSTANKVAVYVKDKEYREVFSTSNYIHLVDTMVESDFVMVSTETMLNTVMKSKLNEKTIVLTTQYRYLKRFKRIVGALYWKKSRFQLLFLQKRLKAQGLNLAQEYDKYIVEEL